MFFPANKSIQIKKSEKEVFSPRLLPFLDQLMLFLSVFWIFH